MAMQNAGSNSTPFAGGMLGCGGGGGNNHIIRRPSHKYEKRAVGVTESQVSSRVIIV